MPYLIVGQIAMAQRHERAAAVILTTAL